MYFKYRYLCKYVQFQEIRRRIRQSLFRIFRNTLLKQNFVLVWISVSNSLVRNIGSKRYYY